MSVSRGAQAVQTVFVINSLAGGGAERVMAALLSASKNAARTELALVLLDREREEYELPSWLPVYRLDARRSFLRGISQLWRLLRTLKPTIIVSFLTRANLSAIVCARILKVPVVISERVNTTSHLRAQPNGRLTGKLVRLLYPLSDAVICVSVGVGETLVQDFAVRQNRIVVVANPVDAPKLARLASEPTTLISPRPYYIAMGRLTPAKNFSMLIQAFSSAEVGEDLIILGDGPEREMLSKLADKLGVGDRVYMPGFLENPFPHIRAAVAFVLSSNAEGFPNSVVEAMALGVPVIATNCPSGPSEILAELPRDAVPGTLFLGKSGLIVEPNDVTAMTGALRQLTSDQLRRELGSNARRRALDFSVQSATDRYWATIHAVAGMVEVECSPGSQVDTPEVRQ